MGYQGLVCTSPKGPSSEGETLRQELGPLLQSLNFSSSLLLPELNTTTTQLRATSGRNWFYFPEPLTMQVRQRGPWRNTDVTRLFSIRRLAVQELSDLTAASQHVTTAHQHTVLSTGQLVSAEASWVLLSFPCIFTEDRFLGHRKRNGVDMILIPLKRSVISLQVVRKPLVPHFSESAAKHCWWRGGGSRADGLPRFPPGPAAAAALTSVSLVGKPSLELSLLLGTIQSPPGSK